MPVTSFCALARTRKKVGSILLGLLTISYVINIVDFFAYLIFFLSLTHTFSCPPIARTIPDFENGIWCFWAVFELKGFPCWARTILDHSIYLTSIFYVKSHEKNVVVDHWFVIHCMLNNGGSVLNQSKQIISTFFLSPFSAHYFDLIYLLENSLVFWTSYNTNLCELYARDDLWWYIVIIMNNLHFNFLSKMSRNRTWKKNMLWTLCVCPISESQTTRTPASSSVNRIYSLGAVTFIHNSNPLLFIKQCINVALLQCGREKISRPSGIILDDIVAGAL